MRRAICKCDSLTRAGNRGTWRFSYIPATALPKGTLLKFDPQISGKRSDWEIPETTAIVKGVFKKKSNVIWAEYQKGTSEEPIFMSAERLDEKRGTKGFSISYEFTLPDQIEEGEIITICMGTPLKTAEEIETHGNAVQTTVNRKRLFKLFIDPKGKGSYGEAELFQMKVLGNQLKNIRTIAPSLVKKGKRCDLMIRFEDRYGNPTGLAAPGTQVQFTHEKMRQNLNWQLSVPEAGYTTIPNLPFNELGTFQIQLVNHATKETFLSDPLWCHDEADHSIFWGIMHGESRNYDSSENLESCIRRFRDHHAMHFYGISPFDDVGDMPLDHWKKMNETLEAYDDSQGFATFSGSQWNSTETSEGIRHFIYSKLGKPIIRSKEGKNQSLQKIYKSLPSKELMAVPVMTMWKDSLCDFSQFNEEYEPVVEIYNCWGSSECTEAEGNPRPIKIEGKKEATAREGAIRGALNRGCRFGFIAGGLDDRGIYEKLSEDGFKLYSSGLTAVVAAEHSRERIFEALRKRKCYATTGVKMIISFRISGAEMGDAIDTQTKPGLAVIRFMTAHIAGTSKLETVEIIRNGQVLKTYYPDSFKFDLQEFDRDFIETIMLHSEIKGAGDTEKSPFIYYYLRVIQSDGQIGWSSPIWVDHNLSATEPSKKTPKKK